MFSKSDSIKELATALAKIQKNLKTAPKTASNDYYNSTYSTLESVIEASAELLSDAGFAITQLPRETGTQTILDTVLIHAPSGQWIASSLGVRTKDTSAQALGSGLSYARRYALMSILRIASEDDDGNAATHQAQPQTSRPQINQVGPGIQGTQSDYKTYIVDFGKYKGRKLVEMTSDEIRVYSTQLHELAAKEGKSLGQGASRFIDMSNLLLKERDVKMAGPGLIRDAIQRSSEDFNEIDLPNF